MAGRPKRTFSTEQIQQMEDYALNGGQNNTIATAMNIPLNTLKRHFGKLLTKKRAERKLKLRTTQTLLATSNPAMAIFLGKNELNQADKQVVEQSGAEQQALTPDELKELKRLAGLALGVKLRQDKIKLTKEA